MEENNQEKIAVIVGRFQVAELTQGHLDLFHKVIDDNYGSILVVLGLSYTKCTQRNPLDFESRRLMLEDAFPGKFNIQYLRDNASDIVWSKNLDTIIDDVAANRDVVLIGSRDCFYNCYFGKYKSNFLEYVPKVYVSGSEQRKSISKQIKSNKYWRAGCIYATMNQYPSVYATVDCAIFNDMSLNQIYLARKKDEDLYRFVGGFSSPTDDSFESAARREAAEETKLETEIIEYIGSCKINDWRYQLEVNKIITNFYAMVKVFGRAEPSDDINELHLLDFDGLVKEDFIDIHRPLFEKLIDWRNAYRRKYPNFQSEVIKQLD